MRERKRFAERAKVLASDEVRQKYFLVYEGENTELVYFDAITELRENLKLNPLIELVPIVRSYNEKGWSNPKKMVDRIIQNLEERDSGKVSYETILNWIMDYFQSEGILANNRTLAKYIWKTLEWICHEKLSVSLNMSTEDVQSTCERIICFLKKETNLKTLMEDVSKIIGYGNLTYAEGLDKICFIVDRDMKSFTTIQYEYVMEQCRIRNFGLYLTNPRFEFWLLMHFEDVKNLDEKQLLENPLVTSKRRYTEQELRNRLPGYEKSRYDALTLVKNIDIAIKNESRYCEDLEKLENTIGSNIGLLICEMRKK
ncbi:MAG: RloB family protein [Ruminococcus flavefaciens]|nr:RloB family protein [Ruminococcus flavefaciens]